jgi:hypothetical protein
VSYKTPTIWFLCVRFCGSAFLGFWVNVLCNTWGFQGFYLFIYFLRLFEPIPFAIKFYGSGIISFFLIEAFE